MSYFKGWANRANQNHDELSGAGLGSAWECWVTASPFTSHWQWCGGCGQDSGWGRVSDCVAVWPSPSILFPCRIPVIVIRWLRLPSVSGIALTPNVSGIAETSGVCLKKKKKARIGSHPLFVSLLLCVDADGPSLDYGETSQMYRSPPCRLLLSLPTSFADSFPLAVL